MIARCCVCGMIRLVPRGVRWLRYGPGLGPETWQLWGSPEEIAPGEPEKRDLVSHTYCPVCAESITQKGNK